MSENSYQTKSHSSIFSGVCTALITPMDHAQKIDLDSFVKILDKQNSAGVNSIVIAGTTGEGSFLNDAEYDKLIDAAIKHLHGKVNIVATVNQSLTQNAVDLAIKLNSKKIDGLMVTVPPYVKPTQNGLVHHYEKINDAVDLPIMIYAHPGRTGLNVSPKAIKDLSNFKNIVAIKDATGDVMTPLSLSCNEEKRDNCDINFLCGDDPLALAYYANGGHGLVSAAASIMPNLFVQIDSLVRNDGYSAARALMLKAMPLLNAVYSMPNPIGVKAFAYLLGLCATPNLRAPYIAANESELAELKHFAQKIAAMESDISKNNSASKGAI